MNIPCEIITVMIDALYALDKKLFANYPSIKGLGGIYYNNFINQCNRAHNCISPSLQKECLTYARNNLEKIEPNNPDVKIIIAVMHDLLQWMINFLERSEANDD